MSHYRKLVKVIILTLSFSTLISYNFTSATVEIPSSARSVNVINKVKSKLKSELKTKDLTFGSQIFIRIFKTSKELEVWIKKDKKYILFKNYPICYFSGKLGPKLKVGDLQSPEGFYYVQPINLNPWSSYHLSFNIGYPNKYDRFHKRTGSLIMIHGNCVSIGCYAMTDKYIEEIYTLVDAALRNGQPYFRIHIFPFRMTSEAMKTYEKNNWIDFWMNLKEGYDFFEKHRIPPNVEVDNSGEYIFDMGN